MTFRWLARAADPGDPVDLSVVERHLVDVVERSFSPRPELVVRTPENLLVQFRAASAQSIPQATPPVMSVQAWRGIVERALRTTALVAFFAFACSFAVSASVIPGRPLYGFRLAVEALSLPPAGTILRVEAQANRLAERIVEARQSATSGDTSGILAAVGAYAAEVRDLRLDLDRDQGSTASPHPALAAVLDAQAAELAWLISGHGDDVRLSVLGALRENALARIEVQALPGTDGASDSPPAVIGVTTDTGPTAREPGPSRGAPGAAKKANPSNGAAATDPAHTDPDLTDPALIDDPGGPAATSTPDVAVAVSAAIGSTSGTVTSAPGKSGKAPGHTKAAGSEGSAGKSGTAPGQLKKAAPATAAPATAAPANAASVTDTGVAPVVDATAAPVTDADSAPGNSGAAPGHNKH